MALVGIAGRHTPAGLVLRTGGGLRLVTPDATPVVVVAGVELTGENMKTSTVFINDNGRFVRCTGPTYSVPEVCEWCGQEWCDCMAQATPLGVAVREACAAILAGELQPCRWCGSIAPCDCLRWHEYMLLDPDPHGDLSEFSDLDLPY